MDNVLHNYYNTFFITWLLILYNQIMPLIWIIHAFYDFTVVLYNAQLLLSLIPSIMFNIIVFNYEYTVLGVDIILNMSLLHVY